MRCKSLIPLLLTACFIGCDDDDSSDDVIDATLEDASHSTADSATKTDGSMEQQPACKDGKDNDGDGKIDMDDPGCESPEDTDEYNPPQCNDGIDNDDDGLTDFPADPGCGSVYDDSEYNTIPIPECSDGIDNDRDGKIDDADPGCSSASDSSEQDPEEPPACSDGQDNDGDGRIDFPSDPGCAYAGGDSEQNPDNPSECNDGKDNDDDGKIDFPDDPGCSGRGSVSEKDPNQKPECSDGEDNDGDGKTDYPEDEDCYAASDNSEKGSCGDSYEPPVLQNDVAVTTDTSSGVFLSNGTCGGKGSPERAFLYRVTRSIDHLLISTTDKSNVHTTLYVRKGNCLSEEAEVGCDREKDIGETYGHTLIIDQPDIGEYFIFVDGVSGTGGNVELLVHEVERPQCSNGIDDDANGFIDYPNDPGCNSPSDRFETSPAEAPACGDGIDNDEDNKTDYPDDVGCLSASSLTEVSPCGVYKSGEHSGEEVPFKEYLFGEPYVMGNTRSSAATNALEGKCGGKGSNRYEIAYAYNNPFKAKLLISTDHEESQTSPKVLYLRSKDCSSQNAELKCDDATLSDHQNGKIVITADPGLYWIIVDDKEDGRHGAFKLTVESTRVDPQCSDDIDNDEDGLVDAADPGCSSASDDKESDDPETAPQCSDRNDNDADGKIDYPNDPGCETRGDNSERDPNNRPACSDGIDNDNDGFIDYPDDPGCSSAGDNREQDPVPPPECNDGIDNDGDGKVDFPNDYDCLSLGDLSESIQ